MATEAIIFQQIVDVNWDQAIYTASPNNSINVVQFAAKGSGTDIGIALTPKGTGYISAHVPDGTAAGGNARGTRAVDLQTSRGSAGQVASGANSFIGGGFLNSATGNQSAALNNQCNATGNNSFAAVSQSNASGTQSAAIGQQASATANASLATGFGSTAHIDSMRAHGSSGIAVGGASQEIAFTVCGKTTTNAEVILTIRFTVRPVLRSGSVMHGILHLIGSKSDGSAVAAYHRQVTISRVGNTTSLVGAVNTVGTDTAAGTSINITADDTNEALSVGVTGISGETWRWSGTFHGTELLIGS